MSAECRKVLKSCLARFVRLDACGLPVTGTSSVLTTKGYISVAATAQIETGAEFLDRNACGDLEINERDPDLFKRYDLEFEFTQVDPSLLELITSARLLSDATDVVKGFAFGESNTVDSFSLELWNRVTPATCAGGEQEWFWFWFPYVTNGVLTDMTFDTNPLHLKVTAHSHSAAGAGIFDRGPGVDGTYILPDTATATDTDHILTWLTTVQPPTPVCGLQPLDHIDGS